MIDDALRTLSTLDSTRLRALASYFERQHIAFRTMIDAAESAERRAAELRARLDTWRASRAPMLRERDARIMRLYRRGLGDDAIGRKVNLSGRQVRRIIKKELRR